MRAMERVAAAERKDPDTWVPQAELADEIGVSAPTLAQVVFRLRKAGLLDAQRGPRGGIGLARAPEKITVLQVIAAIDGTGLAGRCVLGFDACTNEAPCPAHPVWSEVRPRLEKELEQRTLLDLVKAVEGKRRLKRATGRRAS
jgi:Rrf2 family protein